MSRNPGEKRTGGGGTVRRAATIVLPTIVVCLVVLEIGLRLSGRPASNVTEGIFAANGSSYRLRSNMTKVSQTPSYQCVIHTNSWGCRDRAAGPIALGPAPYFTFIGDSLTFANGVDYGDSFVGVVDGQARRRGLGAVVNLAVGGHRGADQEALLREFLASASPRPSWVVVVFTTRFMSGFEELNTGSVVKSGYLFGADSWFFPYLLVMVGDSSASYCFLRDAVRKLQARFSPPNNRIVIEQIELLARDGPAASREFAARFERWLGQLDGEIRSAGASPIYVYLPTSADLRATELIAQAGRSVDDFDLHLYLDRLRRHSQAAGVLLVDLSPTLEALQAKGERLTFTRDPHYNAATNRAIGEALAVPLLDLARAPRTER